MVTNGSFQHLLNAAIVFFVGIASQRGQPSTHQHGDTEDRPGSHLFSIKRAERVLHHCNYDLLYDYMGALVLTYV